MKVVLRFLGIFPALVLLLSASVAGRAVTGDGWLPIDLNDPALKTPTVDKDADAEGIFWDVVVDDGASEGLLFNHYLRVKVFTERGASQSKIDIPYREVFRIEAIAARTVQADGEILELKPDDVFERTIVQANNVKLNAKSFALPRVQPGSIIEYRWREVAPRHFISLLRLPFQRDIPVRRISYHFRQNPRIPNAGLRMAYFQMPPVALIPEGNLFYRVTLTDVAAFRSEPRMPPKDATQSWALVYYVSAQTGFGDSYWLKFSQSGYKVFKPFINGDDSIRRAVQDIIRNAKSSDEKLKDLFQYCRDHITNIHAADSGMSESDIENRKPNKTPSDTLKQGSGSAFEINMLFAAMAAAAGFEARIALLADRGEAFFSRSLPVAYFLKSVVVAVQFGDSWHFFDPGALYVPFGMLRWQQEFESALILDSEKLVFAQTPLSPPATSTQVQNGKFRLNPDGSLEGDVRIEYTGHLGVEMRLANADLSATQREEHLRDKLKARISTAEVSSIYFKNLTDSTKPLSCNYHVRIADYAEMSGSSIFVKPAFFQKGVGALFTSSSRVNDIYFPYPWSEKDEVVIELPAGYRPAELDRIRPSDMGAISAHNAGISVSDDGSQLKYQREFFFGGADRIFFLASDYDGLKNYFDTILQRDNYAVMLTHTATNSAKR